MNKRVKMSPEEESKENIVIKLSGQIEKLQKQAAELGKALPSSVEPYLGRAAELLLYGKNEKGFDDEAAVGISDLDERFMLAKCSLQCAVRSCTESSKKLKPSAGAAQAARLMMFTEAIHDMIDRIDQKASEGKELQIPPKNNSTSNDLNSKELAAERVALHLAAEEQLRQSEKRVIVDGAPVHGSSFEQDSSGGLYAFGQFCGNTRCANIVSDCNAGGICGTRTKLDEAILPRGAKAATVAATNNALTRGSRSLLESTAKALLSAAETAASTKKRQVAARQFQRAALHLEMLRLLSDEQLPPPLETSRRYARWRARHLSPLGENAVVEHGPERRFEDVYEAYLETKNQEKKKKVLGRGGYGVVFICTRKADGCKFACKQLDLSRLSPVGLAQLHEEVGCMRALDHPHIVKLIEVFYSQRKRCHLVMELCKGGELFSVLDEKCAAAGRPVQVFSEGRIAQVTRQMLGALRYMHNCGITHRDLKLENWLIEAQHSWRLKLIDFGLARHFRPGEKVSGTVGSLFYIAPEVLIPNSLYDFRCDLWSLGVIAYMLVSGAPPFWGDCDAEIRHHILAGAYDFPKHFFGGVSDAARDFISRLLQREPSMRLTARQALAHDWLIIQNPNHTHLLGGVEKTNNIFSLVAKSILHFSKLSKFQQLLLNVAAYELEPSAIAQPRTIFEFLDSDHSGTLNFNEFLYIFSQTETQFINLNDLFTMINFSNSKNIHFTEFLAVVAWQFNSFDFDTSRLERIFSLIADTKKEQIVISSLATLSGIDCEIRLSQPLTYTHLLNIWHDAMLTLQGGADFDDASVTTTTNSMIPSSSPNRESLSSIPPDDDLYFNTNLTPSSRPRTPPTPISTPRSARRAYSQQHRPAPSNNQLPPKILVHQSPPSPTFIPTSTTLVSSSG
mmetsp:Transcript_21414/g.32849  ORF Transcript_21414/g.32849 Transcript_21414/m.32849 type:complete len:904 (+) Transcript_21414:97-2808(+)